MRDRYESFASTISIIDRNNSLQIGINTVEAGSEEGGVFVTTRSKYENRAGGRTIEGCFSSTPSIASACEVVNTQLRVTKRSMGVAREREKRAEVSVSSSSVGEECWWRRRCRQTARPSTRRRWLAAVCGSCAVLRPAPSYSLPQPC